MASSLDRFVEAQAPVVADVLTELRAGRKTSHWMWFVFPQIAGLGTSEMARYYALASLAEAREYIAHPVLGHRLIECTRLVNAIEGKSLREILGYPDDLKFCSSMTLFAIAAPEVPEFRQALDKYNGGDQDPRTLSALNQH